MSGGATLWGDPPDAESVRFGGSSWGSSPWGVQHVQSQPASAPVPRGQLPPQFFGLPIIDDLPPDSAPVTQKPGPRPKGMKVVKKGNAPVFQLFGDLGNVRR